MKRSGPFSEQPDPESPVFLRSSPSQISAPTEMSVVVTKSNSLPVEVSIKVM